MKAGYCISCGCKKASAHKNPDGLCDECNGGIYLKVAKIKQIEKG